LISWDEAAFTEMNGPEFEQLLERIVFRRSLGIILVLLGVVLLWLATVVSSHGAITLTAFFGGSIIVKGGAILWKTRSD
jgi:uncharacterized membrane protein